MCVANHSRHTTIKCCLLQSRANLDLQSLRRGIQPRVELLTADPEATGRNFTVQEYKDMGVKHGRYERYGEEVPMSNLLLSTLHAAGVRDESFSDSTGPIPGLVS